MERFLRIATPLILFGLALLVWFETFLRDEGSTPWLGETGVIRFAVGVLCLYAILVVVEQQRMGHAFKEVLQAFKQFHDRRERSGQEPRQEAVALLVGALSSEDPQIRKSAVDHLKRLTGQEFGEDQARWRQWLEDSASQENDT